ncbi:MAG: hypothetical protein JWN86_993 [Planctomycetota bacterium]|nr:hypothetical protein [Planctomycetota bacterium]
MADWDVIQDKPSCKRPRFCPRCKQAGPDGQTLCPECGEAMVDRGYCAVCNRFWLIAAGESCPKHEIPLDDGPPATPDLGEGHYVDWVSIAAYPQPIAAQAPRIRLEAEGIPTFLEGEHMGGHGLYAVATGGVRLQVPRNLVHDARIVLSQTWVSVAEADDDLDDAWDDLAPEPGSRRRTVMRAIIVLILVLPVIHLLVRLVTGG